jgi:hypothetical protein
LHAAEALADRRRIQQRLRRVLVGAVTGVDHRRIHDQRDGCGRTIFAMPDDDGVSAHGVKGARRVFERLALFHR